MENLIGFIIFLIIAVISMIGKMQEARKEREEAQQNARRVRPEDLPEKTRRMLYGDDVEIPQAQPRQGVPPPVPTQAPVRPQPVRDVMSEPWEAPRPVQDQRDVSPAQQPYIPRETPPPVPQRPVQMPRQTDPAEQARRMMEDMWRQAQRQFQQQMETQQPRPQQQPQATRQVRRKRRPEAQPQEGPAPAPQPRPRPAPVAPAPSRQHAFLFGDLKDVRRGILMAEILGPPKGLQ
ncbi:MAG: hypothetical protein IT368_11290 [Candidatus Hydrogenedentes bacterium]|nr:hypothetical protein [Candidatus Hydrogenedentota bacterium]